MYIFPRVCKQNTSKSVKYTYSSQRISWWDVHMPPGIKCTSSKDCVPTCDRLQRKTQSSFPHAKKIAFVHFLCATTSPKECVPTCGNKDTSGPQFSCSDQSIQMHLQIHLAQTHVPHMFYKYFHKSTSRCQCEKTSVLTAHVVNHSDVIF